VGSDDEDADDHDRPLVLVVRGRLSPGAVDTLDARLRVRLAHTDAPTVLLDVAGIERPDAIAIDAVARLYLTARRAGRDLRLCNPTVELRELLALAGLQDLCRVGGQP
jgi:anti-anti-sigma regulatory factor